MRRLIIAILSIAILQSCVFVSSGEELKQNIKNKTVNVSSGNVIEKDFPIGDISNLNISIPATIYYTVVEGAPSLKIVAPDRLFDYVDVLSDEDNLTIKSRTRIKNNKGTVILISTSSLESITLRGANEFYSNDILVSDLMKVQISGAAEISIEGLQANSIDIAISGSAEMDINTVKSSETNIVISGSADAEFENFDSSTISIASSGASSIEVEHVNAKTINYAVSGAGDADFNGQAENVEIAISGAGKVDISELRYINLGKNIKGQGKVIENDYR